MDFFQDDFFQSLTPQPQARVFLGWDRPLATAAAEFLSSNYGTTLSATLVIVPSRQSARRLRDALGGSRSEFGLPTIATPEILYSPAEDSDTKAASPAQTLLAWALALQKTRLTNLRNLFPIDPPERGFSWAMGTAADLLSLRSTLGEAALLMRDVPETFGNSFADTPRWRELARLETEACSRLESAGLQDTATLRQSLAREPSLPAGITDIALVGLPDPPPIAVRALEKLIPTHTINTVVFAPPSESSRFDAWGRPTEHGWTQARIEIEEAAIHLCPDPAGQASAAAARLAEAPGAALSVADPDLTAPLQSALAKGGIATHLPAGRSVAGHELFALLRLLAEVIENRTFAGAAELARHPDLLDAASATYQSDADTAFEPATALHGLDRLTVEHLPALLTDALHFATRDYVHREISPPSVRHLLQHISDWIDRLTKEPLAEALPAFLDQTFATRELDDDFAQVRALLDELLATIEPLVGERFGNADALGLALTVLAGEALPEPRAEGSIDLQGWLETLWDDTPDIVIVGANDGLLPESMGGDPFLPNRARRELGIRDSSSRLVRDSYLLTAILESRRTAGRVDLILGRTNEDGDPLRPSRLLFRCTDDELPARALRLCKGEDLEPAPAPAWQAAWQLQPPPLPAESTIGQRISVTGFRGYLACPFRYYLKFGLGMEELDMTKVEMDARDFGNLCHSALEDFGNNVDLRDSNDESAIRGFLIDRLEKRTYGRYGNYLSVPLAFQLESAKQRLAWAAAIQVKERNSGWQIVDTEWKIHENSEWQIGGLTIRGTIDRIERNEKDGHWRVLDYKTSAAPKKPPAAHLATIPRNAEPDLYPEYSLVSSEGKAQRWTDLQVPLYVLALQKLRGADRVSAGYFNLARSVSETEIEIWHDLGEDTLRSALSCAEGIAGAIRNQEFWPPNPSPEFDDFAPILFGDAAELALPPVR